MRVSVFHEHGLSTAVCFSGGRSRAAAHQEEESEEEMDTVQQSEEDEDESVDSSPKVSQNPNQIS